MFDEFQPVGERLGSPGGRVLGLLAISFDGQEGFLDLFLDLQVGAQAFIRTGICLGPARCGRRAGVGARIETETGRRRQETQAGGQDQCLHSHSLSARRSAASRGRSIT